MGAQFAPNVSYAQKSFWMPPMVLLADVGQVETVLVYLEIVLISMQDRCMVCIKCTIGMAIDLGTPDGKP
jgi:hypothetical protein